MTMKPLVALLLAGSLSACTGQLNRIGQAPDMTPVSDVPAPAYEASLGAANAQYRTPETTPPPAAQATSLFKTGARAFFRDQRATKVGDILTVEIDIADKADIDNRTQRSRSSGEDAGVGNLFGLQTLLPDAVNPGNLVDFGSNSSNTGRGTTQRAEEIELELAAIVTGVLPNGNLVIQGRQEVRVNFEKRELIVTGVVRPEDITRTNRIAHTDIAEARIVYGGEGQLTDVQQARYGQQVFEALFPF
ncbi:MAG: flagellar basal body L-ring protein FlgH [Pacificimonas sp.]